MNKSKKIEKDQEMHLPNVSTGDSANIKAPEEKEDFIEENLQEGSVETLTDIEETNTRFGPLERVNSVMARKGWRRYIGIMLALCGSVLASLGSIIVKIMTREDEEYHYNPITVAVWRFQGLFWPSVVVVLYCVFIRKEDILAAFKSTKHHEKWKILGFLGFRSVLGLSSILLKYYAFTFMDVADASVVALSTPVFVTVVAYIFLGESCGIVPVLCALLTLSGVSIISRPPFLTGENKFHKDILKGVAFAFSSMVCLTLVFVVLRKLKRVHYAVITASFGFTGAIISYLLTHAVHPFEFPRKLKHWLLAAGLGLATYIGQSCVTLSLKFEEAGPISLVRTSDVIFSFIWQKIFLNVNPDVFSYTGATIIVTGILISGLRKWASGLPVGHATRRRLSFLLH